MVYQKIAVEVNVKDENDNAPIFNQSASENGMITIEVAENAEIGKRIEMNILRAVDEDPGLFGDIEYKITGENGVQFELVDENFRTYLIPRSELDRETNPHWIGTVTARDGGGRQAKTRLKVSQILRYINLYQIFLCLTSLSYTHDTRLIILGCSKR